MSPFLRTSVNLVAFGVVTVVLLAYFALTIAHDIFLDDRYPVTLVLEDSGGLIEDHFVTVLGRDVGRIESMRLVDGGVEFELRIRPEHHVPRHAVVHVLRRSAIGEHTINLIPVDEGWEPGGEGRLIPRFIEPVAGWEAADAGDQLQPAEVLLPVPTRDLLARAEDLFAAIPKEELNLLVHELADAFGGRGEVLVDLAHQSYDLYVTLVDGIPEFERQLHASRPVLQAVRDSRDDVAAAFTHLADLSEILADSRPTMEELIDNSQRLTGEADALIRPARADLSCIIEDLRDYQQVNVDNLEWILQGLDMSHYFWDANDLGRQYDPWRPGLVWLRSATVVMAPSTAEPYDELRETPATRPAAACVSPAFGVGVNAVRQPDHQPAHVTSPGIDWAPLVDEDDHEPGVPDDPPAAAPRMPDEPLPETGGGPAALLVALTLGAGLLLRRLRT